MATSRSTSWEGRGWDGLPMPANGNVLNTVSVQCRVKTAVLRRHSSESAPSPSFAFESRAVAVRSAYIVNHDRVAEMAALMSRVSAFQDSRDKCYRTLRAGRGGITGAALHQNESMSVVWADRASQQRTVYSLSLSRRPG